MYNDILDDTILPALGKKKITAVTKADITTIHHDLHAPPYMANRNLALLSRLFSLAETWGLRLDHTTPCKHVEPYPEKPRTRYLSKEELKRLGSVLSEAEREGLESPAVIFAIQLLVSTGCHLLPRLSSQKNAG